MSQTLRQSDLVQLIADKSSISKKEVSTVLDLLFESITTETFNGNKITIHGFGTFERRSRAPRIARNLKTGVPVQVPASSNLAFSASKTLKR